MICQDKFFDLPFVASSGSDQDTSVILDHEM